MHHRCHPERMRRILLSSGCKTAVRSLRSFGRSVRSADRLPQDDNSVALRAQCTKQKHPWQMSGVRKMHGSTLLAQIFAPLMAAVTGGTRPGLLSKSRSAGGSETVASKCRWEASSRGSSLWDRGNFVAFSSLPCLDFSIVPRYDITNKLPCQYLFFSQNRLCYINLT